jgi:hypothetical protein
MYPRFNPADNAGLNHFLLVLKRVLSRQGREHACPLRIEYFTENNFGVRPVHRAASKSRPFWVLYCWL